MDRQSSTRQPWQAAGRAFSRRKIFKYTAGAVAAGAAGATLFSPAGAAPVLAAADAVRARQATSLPAQTVVATVEQAAVAPTVISLTDAATIAVDASQGNDFRVTLGASRAMGNPANPSNGQQIIFQITQGSAGSAGITWGSGYEFSTGLPQPTLSSTAGQTDLVGFIYNAAIDKWLLAAYVNGFS